MSAPDHRSLGVELGAALVLSTCAAALLAALSPWLGTATALRAVIALLGFAYLAHVVARSGERVGRVTTLACWLVVAAGAALLGVPLTAYVLLHVGLVWLVRSLYSYSGLVPALADLCLALLGAAFAAWAAQRTGGAWLALWCFLLAQAFHVLLPAAVGSRGAAALTATDDGFARAQRAAEAAVRRLSSTTP